MNDAIIDRHAEYNIVNGIEQLNLIKNIIALRKRVWPDFIRLADDIIFKIYKLYPDFQVSLLDKNNELIAIANSLPIIGNKSLIDLSNDGVSWVINTVLDENYDVNLANILCAISITVSDKYRNRGISKILLQYLNQIKHSKKYTSLIVPVRPSLKCLYPLISIDKYIKWKNKAGLIFDPWLRTHISVGANILNVCHRSAFITATISQWEQWTGLCFPDDGSYIIKNALVPIEIDFMNNQGTYIEPNVWVSY
ncbi:MAG: N-acetyltransferase [Gammaproteobacteria bacterium]|nr:N-acetyltransferase [Gammaproteobacteria bacterium]